jgi:phosphoribosyl 1,2-cyclic phosphodiesterase/CheY-like chemotaxis protein
MEIRFWGTRGSLATPGMQTVRYGGNTSCVELRTASGTLIMFDCGTGARSLGQALMASGERPLRGHILISHTHWDHIQGLPFFAPLFIPGNEWDIYAPHGLGQHIEDTLAGQMQYSYFPVTLKQLGATIRYHDLTEGELQIDDAKVSARYMNHPGLTLGYRVECGGVSVVYSTDHEPHTRQQAEAVLDRPGGDPRLPVHPEDRQHLDFVAGADLLIHDAQYTVAEYPTRVGWGHSTIDYSLELALAARVRRLALFHHDPSRTDDLLDDVLAACRRRVAEAGGGPEVLVAAEGDALELPESAVESPRIVGRSAIVLPDVAARAGKVVKPREPAAADDSIVAWLQARGHRYRTKLLVAADPETIELVRDALRPDGFLIMAARDGQAAIDLAREHKPVLILVDDNVSEVDAITVCRTIRAAADGSLRDARIVLLASGADDATIAAGFSAGFTDYLTKPFSAQYVRSRARAWLMRAGVKRDARASF